MKLWRPLLPWGVHLGVILSVKGGIKSPVAAHGCKTSLHNHDAVTLSIQMPHSTESKTVEEERPSNLLDLSTIFSKLSVMSIKGFSLFLNLRLTETLKDRNFKERSSRELSLLGFQRSSKLNGPSRKLCGLCG